MKRKLEILRIAPIVAASECGLRFYEIGEYAKCLRL